MTDRAIEPPSIEAAAEALSEPIRRYLERLVGNSTVAEDLRQETLLRISRGLPGFEGRSSLKTWSFSIATRVVADHFRHPDARAVIVDIDETESLPDPGPDIEERLALDEMNDCVRSVIDSLPENYRAAVVLHDLEGLTAAETADICGCTLATAKIRIHRARVRLKQALQSECTFYRDRENVFRCDRRAHPAPSSSVDGGSDRRSASIPGPQFLYPWRPYSRLRE